MGMFHQEVCYVTDTASCPVSQSKECLPTQVIALLDQIPQDEPLIGFKDTGGKLLLRLDLDAAGRIAFENFLFIDQPLTKVFENRLDTSTMTHTIALFLEQRQI